MKILMHTAPITKDITKNNIYRSYIIGFLLSAILIIIPFSIVIQGYASEGIITVGLIFCALVQIIVHLVYFLHLNICIEQYWNLISFGFTILIIILLVGGSMWIMSNLNQNLMNC